LAILHGLRLTFYSFPETTRKTIEEIAAVFGDAVAVKIDEADQAVDLDAVRRHDEVEKTTAATHVEQL
jgi:hypothetical protein